MHMKNLFLSLLLASPCNALAARYMIDSIDFFHETVAVPIHYTSSGVRPTAGQKRLFAPVKIPIGSVISSVSCQFYDSNVNRNIEVQLVQKKTHDHDSESEIIMASFSSSGSAGHMRAIDSSVDSTRIDDFSSLNGIFTFSNYYVSAFFPIADNSLRIKTCSLIYT